MIHDLGVKATAVVLDDTPSVLSMGQLIKDHNLQWIWKHGEHIEIILPGVREYNVHRNKTYL